MPRVSRTREEATSSFGQALVDELVGATYKDPSNRSSIEKLKYANIEQNELQSNVYQYKSGKATARKFDCK